MNDCEQQEYAGFPRTCYSLYTILPQESFHVNHHAAPKQIGQDEQANYFQDRVELDKVFWWVLKQTVQSNNHNQCEKQNENRPTTAA